jgi:hypothetical protein
MPEQPVKACGAGKDSSVAVRYCIAAMAIPEDNSDSLVRKAIGKPK